MRDSKIRSFLHLRSFLATQPGTFKNHTPWNMATVLDRIDSTVQYGISDDKTIRVTQIRNDALRNIYTILLSCADKRIPNPTQQDSKTLKITPVSPKNDHIWTRCAHIFISCVSDDADGGYPTMLEVAPGLGRTVVADALNSWFFERARFKQSTGGHRTIDYYPQIRFEGEISGQLETALKSGKLMGVDLIRRIRVPSKAPGEVGGFVSTRQTMSYRRKRSRSEGGHSISDGVRAIFDLAALGARKKFSKMRVYLDGQDPGLPGQITFDLKDDALADAKAMVYINRTLYESRSILNDGYSEIDEGMLSHISERMIAQRQVSES